MWALLLSFPWQGGECQQHRSAWGFCGLLHLSPAGRRGCRSLSRAGPCGCYASQGPCFMASYSLLIPRLEGEGLLLVSLGARDSVEKY